MTVVTLVTLIIENINEAEVTTFKMSFWSNLLKVIFFHLLSECFLTCCLLEPDGPGIIKHHEKVSVVVT